MKRVVLPAVLLIAAAIAVVAFFNWPGGDGGVNDALNLDSHGKSLSFLLLDLPLRVPAALAPLLRGPDS